MLTRHAPFPALAVDRHWKILQMNVPAQRLFSQIGAEIGISLLDVLLRPAVQAMIANWPEVAQHVVQRLRVESAALGGDERLEAAISAFSRVPAPEKPICGPVIPTIYHAGALVLSLFSTIAQFGTPEDLALDDLKIELFFPSDDATEQVLVAMAEMP